MLGRTRAFAADASPLLAGHQQVAVGVFEVQGGDAADILAFAILPAMNLEFTGKIFFWRGPAPFYFVTVPAQQSRDIKAISSLVTYGWGVIPVRVRIGKTEWTTSLFPKDGRYLVPIKARVQNAENLKEGDQVTIRLEVV